MLSFGCALLQVGVGTPEAMNILLDTSLGCVQPPLTKQMTKLRELRDLRHLLAAAGITPEEVNIVTHSHLHRDHTSWNVVPDGADGFRPLFTNAKHIVQQVEHDYWSSTETLRNRCHWDTYIAPLERAGMIELVEGNVEIAPGVSFVLTPGHTPGHSVTQISSMGQMAYFIGDMCHQVVL